MYLSSRAPPPSSSSSLPRYLAVTSLLPLARAAVNARTGRNDAFSVVPTHPRLPFILLRPLAVLRVSLALLVRVYPPFLSCLLSFAALPRAPLRPHLYAVQRQRRNNGAHPRTELYTQQRLLHPIPRPLRINSHPFLFSLSALPSPPLPPLFLRSASLFSPPPSSPCTQPTSPRIPTTWHPNPVEPASRRAAPRQLGSSRSRPTSPLAYCFREFDEISPRDANGPACTFFSVDPTVGHLELN